MELGDLVTVTGTVTGLDWAPDRTLLRVRVSSDPDTMFGGWFRAAEIARAGSGISADDLLGGTTAALHAPLRYLPQQPTAAQQEEGRSSALWQQGDMRLVWVNEGDLAVLLLTGKAVSFGKDTPLPGARARASEG